MIGHFHSLSEEAIERSGGGGKEGMEGRREVAKAKKLAENKVHVWKVHVCPLLSFHNENLQAWPWCDQFLCEQLVQDMHAMTQLSMGIMACQPDSAFAKVRFACLYRRDR